MLKTEKVRYGYWALAQACIGFFLSIIALILSACSGAGVNGVQTGMQLQQVSEEPVADATLAPGDSFEVRVYGEKELTGEFRVASDGTFDYPLLGNVQVGGLTPSEVSTLLETLFIDGDFLKSPQVSILVKKYASKKVSVFGQVNRPGTFSWQEGMGVVEAISLAGGFTPMAKTDNTMVTRQVNGKKQNFVVPVEEIGQGKSADFVLRPGDIIFVPERIF
ncbi:MAG: polysaccharide biosynthesis/export family protein [Deltaproteobacteria bacterium]|nr:polysaccharide biosynthesis/export family protein [Deltaproteobacteria bacterium]